MREGVGVVTTMELLPGDPAALVEERKTHHADVAALALAVTTVVLAGAKGFKEIPRFVSDKVMMKEITIKGAIGVTRTGYANAIRLLESRKYPIERMHTHDFPLEEAETAIRTLAREIPGEQSIQSCLLPEKD